MTLDRWTLLEILPFLPVDPALLPGRIPPVLAMAAGVSAPLRAEWREQYLDIALEGVPQMYLEYLGWHVNLSPALREKLAKNRSAKVKKAAQEGPLPPPEPRWDERARDYSLTSEELEELYEQGCPGGNFLQHPHVTDEQIRRWCEADPSMLAAVWRYPYAPADLLLRAFEIADRDVTQVSIAAHPNAPEEVLARAPIKGRLINPTTPPEVLREAFYRVPDHEGFSHEQYSIAENYALSRELIQEFDAHLQGTFRSHFSKLPNAPEEWRNLGKGNNFQCEFLSLCPLTSRERLVRLMDEAPGSIAKIPMRRDADEELKILVAEKAAMNTLPFPGGLRIGDRRRHYPPVSTDAIETFQTPEDEEIEWLARVLSLDGRVVMVCHGRGNFTDAEEVHRWVQGMERRPAPGIVWGETWDDERSIISGDGLYTLMARERITKGKDKDPGSDADHEAFETAVRSWAGAHAGPIWTLVDSGRDENQELGIYLLGEGEKRALLVCYWKL